jgi:hypothetical protein
MLTNIRSFVKSKQDDIILFIGIVLISLLCFALGFISCKQQDNAQIKIDYSNE